MRDWTRRAPLLLAALAAVWNGCSGEGDGETCKLATLYTYRLDLIPDSSDARCALSAEEAATIIATDGCSVQACSATDAAQDADCGEAFECDPGDPVQLCRGEPLVMVGSNTGYCEYDVSLRPADD